MGWREILKKFLCCCCCDDEVVDEEEEEERLRKKFQIWQEIGVMDQWVVIDRAYQQSPCRSLSLGPQRKVAPREDDLSAYDLATCSRDVSSSPSTRLKWATTSLVTEVLIDAVGEGRRVPPRRRRSREETPEAQPVSRRRRRRPSAFDGRRQYQIVHRRGRK